MIDYKFVPDHLTFKHGVHYRLHLENHGKETHEFTAPTFFASAKIDNPDVLNREPTEIVMQPGDAKDVFLTPAEARQLRSALRRPRLVWHGGRHHRPIAGAKVCVTSRPPSCRQTAFIAGRLPKNVPAPGASPDPFGPSRGSRRRQLAAGEQAPARRGERAISRPQRRRAAAAVRRNVRRLVKARHQSCLISLSRGLWG